MHAYQKIVVGIVIGGIIFTGLSYWYLGGMDFLFTKTVTPTTTPRAATEEVAPTTTPIVVENASEKDTLAEDEVPCPEDYAQYRGFEVEHTYTGYITPDIPIKLVLSCDHTTLTITGAVSQVITSKGNSEGSVALREFASGEELELADLMWGEEGVINLDNDYNLDGYKDITSLYSNGSGVSQIDSYVIFLYDPATRVFVFSPVLSNLQNIYIDEANLKEVSQIFGWPTGYDRSRYAFKNNVLTQIFNEKCSLVETEDETNTWSLVRRELNVHGVFSTTTNKKVQSEFCDYYSGKPEVSTDTTGWNVFKDETYSFEFKYPSRFGKVTDVPQSEQSKLTCNTLSAQKSVTATKDIKSIGVEITCDMNFKETASTYIHDSDGGKGTTTVIEQNDRKSYFFDSVGSTNYWNQELFIPLPNKTYVRLSQSRKLSWPPDVSDLTQEEFNTIVSTFKVLK